MAAGTGRGVRPVPAAIQASSRRRIACTMRTATRTQNADQHDDQHDPLDLPHHVAQALHVAPEAVAHRVARADHHRHVDDGARHVGDEEGREPHPEGPREGPRGEADAGDEPGDEYRERPAAAHEGLHGLEALGVAEHPARVARHRGLPVAAPEPVADVVAHHRADDADREHQGEAELAAPDQVAGQRQDRLLRHREAHVAEHHHHEDGEVAPVPDEPLEVAHESWRAEEITRRRAGG